MKIKKRTLKIFILAIIILVATYLINGYLHRDSYSFKDGKFSYDRRPNPKYTKELLGKNESFDKYRIVYESRPFLDIPTKVFGILLLPHSDKKVPGVMLLPGGGITKDAEYPHAVIIAEMGYAVLVIDQRGLGETGGQYLGIEEDYKIFSSGKEPIQHLSIYDALAGNDVLRDIKQVDREKIVVAGLSMGGRYAIIAAALDLDVLGVVGISTSGFHFDKDPRLSGNPYLKSIDPDTYIGEVSPRYVFLLHGKNDTKVPTGDAERTFDLAKQPKSLFIAEGCGHGYCEGMQTALKEALAIMFR